MYLNQSVALLCQTYKNFYLGQGSGWKIDSVFDRNINIFKI